MEIQFQKFFTYAVGWRFIHSNEYPTNSYIKPTNPYISRFSPVDCVTIHPKHYIMVQALYVIVRGEDYSAVGNIGQSA